MTLPTTGPIGMGQVITELTLQPGAISLGQTNVRTLAEKPSGQISLSDLRGKSGAVTKGNLIIGDGGVLWGYNRSTATGASGVGAIGSLTPPNMLIGTGGQVVTAILCDQSIGIVRTYVYVSGTTKPNESKTLVIRNLSGTVISQLTPFSSTEFHPASGGINSYYLFYDMDSLPQTGTVNVSIE
ncbi:hypothetical protein [Pseudomonas phage Astolliot]|nr:hypothetical protein [Pseudomonas phage Astolliot]